MKTKTVAQPKSDLPAAPVRSGVCLCGCGQTCSKKSYFSPGHDHRLQGYLVHRIWGGTAGLAAAYPDMVPQGGPPNRRLEQEARRAERDVRRAMLAAEPSEPAAVVVEEPSAPVEERSEAPRRAAKKKVRAAVPKRAVKRKLSSKRR